MLCNKCKTENDDDGKFCKECGHRLEHPDAVEEKAPADASQIGELIYAAYKHEEAGEIDDAIGAVQGALMLHADNASAHSLLGSLFEKKGDLDAAAYEYTRAVALDPSFVAEHSRLEALRANQLARRPSSVLDAIIDKARPYTAHIAASLSLLAVLIIGLLVMGHPSGQRNPGSATEPTPQSTVAQGYGEQPFPSGRENMPFQSESPRVLRLGQPSDTVAPNQGNQGVPPAVAQQSAQSTSSIQPRPQPAPATAIAPPPAAIQPDYSPVITPIEDTGGQSVPTPPAPSRSQLNPEVKAMQLQSQGLYQEAVASYRDALGQTRDKGRIYQQIGLCYQRLGERELAVDSYSKAKKSYQDQLAAGGDPADLDRNIRACQRAIEVNK